MEGTPSVPMNVEGLDRAMRAPGREEGQEREMVEAEDRAHVRKRKAGRYTVGCGAVPGHAIRAALRQ